MTVKKKNLQDDLNNIKEWTEKWQLRFHPEKCKYMRISRCDVEDHGYTMYGDKDKQKKRHRCGQ